MSVTPPGRAITRPAVAGASRGRAHPVTGWGRGQSWAGASYTGGWVPGWLSHKRPCTPSPLACLGLPAQLNQGSQAGAGKRRSWYMGMFGGGCRPARGLSGAVVTVCGRNLASGENSPRPRKTSTPSGSDSNSGPAGAEAFSRALQEAINSAEQSARDNPLRLVIGRTRALTRPGTIGPDEYTLVGRLPTKGLSEREIAYRASSMFRAELRNVTQVRDATPGDFGGKYLNMERTILSRRGWIYDPATHIYYKP